MAHTPRSAADAGCRRHLLRLLDGVRQRLLAEHVLAGLQGGDRDLGVAVTRGADVDQVDVVAFDQAPPVGLGRGEAEPVSRRADRLRVAAGDRGQLGGERQVEEPCAHCARPGRGRRP